MDLLQPMTIAGLLVGGMGVALLGSVKVPLAGKLNIDEARMGGLVSMFGLAMIPVIFVTGFLTDQFGMQAVLWGGSLVMAASLVMLAHSSSYVAALVAVLLLSAGWSALINVINVLIPLAFADKPEDFVFAMNLGNVFFGLGAFLTPLIMIALLRRAGMISILYILAGFVLLSPVLAIGVDFAALAPPAPEEGAASATAAGMATLLSMRIVWLCTLAFFFYAPLEAAMAAWATTYLGDQGVKEGTASGLLSAFWLTFMATRLITALALPAGQETTLILGLSLACVAVLTGVVMTRGSGMAMAMVIATGGIFGPVFPTIIAVLLGSIPQALHGRAVGLFFAIGAIGWTIVPMLIGAYASRTNLQRGFLVAIASAMGLCVMALALLRYGSG